MVGTATTISEGGSTTFSRTQSYDPATGRPLISTYPSGLAVKTEYTAYGLPSALINAASGSAYWTAAAHNAWGQVSKEYLANGITGTYITDLATGQPTRRSWTRNDVPLEQIDYTYDSFANLKSQTRAGNTETYAYDVRQRLIRSSRVLGGNVEYDYAANGNLLRKTDYSADMANAYTYGLGVSQGNGECGPHAASRITLPGNGLDTYHCDGNGNIVGGNTVNLRFAADNRAVYSTRLSTTLNATPSFCESTTPLDRIFCDGFEARPSIPSGTTLWAYAPDGFRYYKATSQGVTYFDRQGYERTGAVERHELGPVIVERRNGVDTITAVLTDRLGSTIATVDTATETRAYDAFGQVRNRDLTNKLNGTLDLPRSIRGFTQHEHADDVRLIHMKGRLYDYKLGRFLSVDPIVQFPANSQSLNPYSYIMNNPLAGTDPTGFAIKGNNGGCTAMTGSRICGVDTGAAGGVTSKTTIARDGEGGYVRITESVGAYGERSFSGVWRPGNGARGQSSQNKTESPSEIEGSKTRGQQGLQQAADFGKAFADTAGKVLEVAAPIDPEHPLTSVAAAGAGKVVGGAIKVSGGLFRKMEKEVLEEIDAERKTVKALQIGPKWRARDITDTICERGCGAVALQIQRHIGGDIVRIMPIDAPILGKFRGKNWNWSDHEVVVKDGRVYDLTTGYKGLPAQEYKSLWQYSDAINFGF